MAMRQLPIVDTAKDRADYDKVSKILDDTDDAKAVISRAQWILYDQLYNRGCRKDRAPHEIARLAPRVTA